VAIDAIIRAQFKSESEANKSVQQVLDPRPGDDLYGLPIPFKRVAPGTYICARGDDGDAMLTIKTLMGLIDTHADSLVFLSVTVARHGDNEP